MKRKFMYPIYTPFLILAALYLILYRDDPLAVFRRKSGSWNRVFHALGLPFSARRRFSVLHLLLPAGVIVDVIGLFAPDLFNFIMLELIGSVAVFSCVVVKVPVPYPKMTIALPYPRMGRAEFSGPEKGDPARWQSPLSPSKVERKTELSSGKKAAISPSVLKMFYVSNRNAHFFSLPDARSNLTDTIAMFLEQSRPQFAWVQFVYERANVHQLLEYVKFGLLNRQQKGAWQPEPLIKKVSQALSKELFAVSARGVLVGADPFNINLSISDEIDSLAVFESRDPNLIYSLASAPAGLETITVGENAAENYFEASPVPSIEEPFHFPPSGTIELVYDGGGLHVLFGGEYGKAIRALGVSAVRYEPLTQFAEAFKGSLNKQI